MIIQFTKWFKDCLKKFFGNSYWPLLMVHPSWESWCLASYHQPCCLLWKQPQGHSQKQKVQEEELQYYAIKPWPDFQLCPLWPWLPIPYQYYQSQTCLQSSWSGPFLIFVSQSQTMNEWIILPFSAFNLLNIIVSCEEWLPYSWFFKTAWFLKYSNPLYPENYSVLRN